MAPSAKRRKSQPQRYDCTSCLVNRVSSQFPDSNPNSACSHLINTCKRCLRDWIEAQMDAGDFKPRIRCPECEQKMDRVDVEVAVTKKVFARYVALERKHIAVTTPGWRWCLAPGCEAGQVHVDVKVAKEGDDDEDAEKSQATGGSEHDHRDDGLVRSTWGIMLETPNFNHQQQQQHDLSPKPLQRKPDICKCNECGAKACVPCDRPWHENETCDEYKARVQDRIKEEDASLAVIQKQTKQCPNCSRNIEKAGGCQHMFCTQCQSEFCWNCLHLINTGGQYCRCPMPPQRLIPTALI